MPGRIVRSRTADLVAEVLGSREGREHLSQYGWVQGMPIVIATPKELLSDTMGLASVHGRAVLIALLNEDNGELNFMHVSVPNAGLAVVEAHAADATIQSLFEQVAHDGVATFRVEYWQHSAVAHWIPVFASGDSGRASKKKTPLLS
ncbi:hypothetical protein [Glutamicibacter sp. X7]